MESRVSSSPVLSNGIQWNLVTHVRRVNTRAISLSLQGLDHAWTLGARSPRLWVNERLPVSCVRGGRKISEGLHVCRTHVLVSSYSEDPSPAEQAQQQDDVAAKRRVLEVSAAIIMVVGSALVNRILYKMALVPLENYVFFLAQFQTFSYVFVYAAVLMIQSHKKLLHPDAWQIPLKFKGIFMGIGFVEAVSSLLSFIGAARLPGVMVPLLSQTILLWQVVLIYTVLKKQMSVLQLLGVAGVVCGVGLAAWPGSGHAASQSLWSNVDPKFALLYVFSCLFPALDTMLKDRLFKKGKAIQGGKDVDLFIVNTFGSASQALFVFLLLPFVTTARGIPLHGLGNHLQMGWECFRGLTPSCGSDCTGAPMLPVLYVLINLLFNISALNLIGKAGNIAFSLVMSGIVPLTMWAFTLPLPFLGAPPRLGINFALGSLLLTASLIVYNSPTWLPKLKKVWYKSEK
jgi:drug/metabolite transporter (DMT)-like permease